jgi:uncharacterized membrane protein YedE/YeeE
MNALIGGAIIGLAASILLLFNGRVTGISGITAGIINSATSDKSWRILFVLGLITGGVILRFVHPSAFTIISKARAFDYMLAGFLVGIGTVIGGGCTSGHGVCGISRFSVRSIVATVVFMLAGFLSLYVFKMVRGGV